LDETKVGEVIMGMPLEGIRVLEVAHAIFGPHAGAQLASMGAEVIKVENPAGGDAVIRGYRGGALPRPREVNYYFELENHDKRSLALDLKTEPGREIAYRLVERSDVFLTNFQPQALQNLRLDYETLSRINPRLIYAQGTGWGLEGPDRDRPGYDFVVFASSGLMDAMGEPGTPPVQCRPGMGDHITAILLDYAIVMALFHRERTGEGQMVHACLLSGLLQAGASALQATLVTGEEIHRVDRRSFANPLWSFYQMKDGRWLQFAMPDSDRYWPDFCRALEIEACQHDPRFDTLVHREEHAAELVAIIDAAMATRTTQEWLERFKGTSIIWGLVNTYSEVAANPQLRANGLVMELDHPVGGRIEVAGVPVQLSKTPGRVRAAAPELGQHTEEILLELGHTWEDIIRLRDQGVIG
jgi:crotonobetainyl-CoA:carnitine CoA-transferase CaiB-like acyl-CoA transferase